MALSIAGGLLLEAALGDPPNAWHPVAWLGRWAEMLERRLYAPSRLRGALLWVLAVAPFVAAATLLAHALGVVGEALVLWVCLGWRSLFAHVRAVEKAPSLVAMRRAAAAIVGREVQRLTREGCARAALESLAENAHDAVVATLFWFAVGGAPLAALHRAANTLDALWGHRTPRHRHFGWWAARADDLLGWPSARLAALCIWLAGGLRGDWRMIAAQARRHPSWNAGWPEAALAHALGVRLGGPVARAHGREMRPWLGPRHARSADACMEEARALVARALALAAGVALLCA